MNLDKKLGSFYPGGIYSLAFALQRSGNSNRETLTDVIKMHDFYPGKEKYVKNICTGSTNQTNLHLNEKLAINGAKDK